jgi:transposase
MRLTLTAEERAALHAAQAHSRAVRHWRRFQAVLLRADGMPIATVARTFNCTETSVCNWTAAWRTDGVAGVAEGGHPGKARRLDPAAEAALEALLTASDPQVSGYAATGWTVPRHVHRAGEARLGGGRAHHPADAAPPGLALEAPQVRVRAAGPRLCSEKN